METDSYVARVSLACFLPHFLLIGFFGIGLLTIWYPFLTLLTSRLEVTKDQIEGTCGWLRRKTLKAPIHKIVSVEIEETILGRIFHYGTIVLSTCQDRFSFYYRSNAEQFGLKLMEKMQ